MSGGERATPVTSSYVDAGWLRDHLDGVVVLDATITRARGVEGASGYADGRPGFEEAHVPGARFADLFTAFSEPDAPFLFTRPTADRLQAAARALGIDADSTVVVYDRLGGAWAARVWWVLRSFGFRDVRVLDGGLQAWTVSGGDVEAGPSAPPAREGDFVAEERDGFIVDLDEVSRLAENPDPAVPVVCGVRASQYRGDRGGDRAGHIPNSQSLPYPELLNDDGTLSRDAVRAASERLGLAGAEKVVLYCGGAINAAGLALALSEIGLTELPLFDGSLNEWRAHPELPLRTGEAS
jgi:thiosulfate/3-mercaptopyruvate sulfurtransferase